MTRRFTNNFRRPLSATCCAVASLLLVACGGGEPSADSRLNETLPYSEQLSANETGDANPNPGQPNSANDGNDLDQQANGTNQAKDTNDSPNGGTSVARPVTEQPNDSVANNGDSVAGHDVDNNQDDTANPNNGNSNADDDNATPNNGPNPRDPNGPNGGIVGDVVDAVDDVVDDVVDGGLGIPVVDDVWVGPVARVRGQITLEWFPPQVRENGEMMRDGEVGGYELRYRKAGSDKFDHVILKGEWAVAHELTNLRGDYQFAVAAYDVNGLYSNFVNITPES